MKTDVASQGLTGILGTQSLVIKWTLTLFIRRPQPHWLHLQEPRKLIWFLPREFFALLNSGEILPSSVWKDLGCEAARPTLLPCAPGLRSLPSLRIPHCSPVVGSCYREQTKRPERGGAPGAQGSSGNRRRPKEGKKPSFWRICANERGGTPYPPRFLLCRAPHSRSARPSLPSPQPRP